MRRRGRSTASRYSPERPLSEERQILSYAKPPKTSRLLEGFRILGGSFCVSTGLAGLGVIGYGVFLLWQLIDAPTRDKPHYMFVGSVISLVGLLIVGFSVRWFINALRPKRKATIDGGTAGE